MISFQTLNEQNIEDLCALFRKKEDRETAKDVLLYALDPGDEDVEITASYSHGCLLLRIFDMGRYLFNYPQAIAENADVKQAVADLYEYCMLQEVPYRFMDVYAEDFSLLLSGVRRAKIEAIDGEGGETVYSVEAETELQMLEEIPAMQSEDGSVILSEIYPEDTKIYAELCRDTENNRYWGYDYHDSLETGKEPSDAWFYEQAKSQFVYRTALYFAIRDKKEKMVGEAELFAFDAHGSCEIAIRVLPGEQRKGYARSAFLTAAEICRSIGIVRLNARVKEENLPSLALMRGCFGQKGRTVKGTVRFSMAL